MSKFYFSNTNIDGLKIIEPTVFGDDRGYFMESYNQKDFYDAGLKMNFVQENQSSSKKGVLRGLHFQQKHPQGKLVRITKGEVYDVAIDIRKESKTFGNWFGIVLSEENKKQLYIPAGFAHGFLVLSDIAEFVYKCTDFYHPEDENGLKWDDTDLNIDWQRFGLNNFILSEKDKKWKRLKEIAF
jgi:dTDP-4-dehydrorhamnose 3,5-epimerase